jgi:uncharacterized cupredoxin-like copper-binding protein
MERRSANWRILMKRMVIMAAFVVLLGAGCSKKSSTAVSAGDSTSTTAGGSGDNGYGGYGSGSGATSSTAAASGAGKAGLTGTVTDKGTVDATGKTTVALEADNDPGSYYFKPTFVKVDSAKTVRVTVKNEGSVQHNFSIDQLNINETIDPGKSIQVNVFLPAGTTSTRFYCRFHHDSGMQGAFTTT